MHVVRQSVCGSLLLLLLLLLPHAPFCGGLLCVWCAFPPGPQDHPHGGWPTITTSTLRLCIDMLSCPLNCRCICRSCRCFPKQFCDLIVYRTTPNRQLISFG